MYAEFHQLMLPGMQWELTDKLSPLLTHHISINQLFVMWACLKQLVLLGLLWSFVFVSLLQWNMFAFSAYSYREKAACSQGLELNISHKLVDHMVK